MRLELSIEELVLVGFEPRDRHRVADAIERELRGIRWPDRTAHRVERPKPFADRPLHGSPRAVAQAVRTAVVSALAERSDR